MNIASLPEDSTSWSCFTFLSLSNTALWHFTKVNNQKRIGKQDKSTAKKWSDNTEAEIAIKFKWSIEEIADCGI